MYMKLIADEKELEQEGFSQKAIAKFFEAIKALEDGAHIVNDEIMYPPVEHIKGGLFKEE